MSKEWEAVLILFVSVIATGMIITGVLDILTAAPDGQWSLNCDRFTRGWMCLAIGATISCMAMRLMMRIRIEELERKLRESKEEP